MTVWIWLHPRTAANIAMKDLKPNLCSSFCAGPCNYKGGQVKKRFKPIYGFVIIILPPPYWMVTCQVLRVILEGLILAHASTATNGHSMDLTMPP